jgi:tetratricopeptide (TPR) repeat protein
MKKLWLLLIIPVLGLAAYLTWQNLPSKRYAKHMVKARLFQKENNMTAARLEYEKAYDAQGKFTPYASLEVLALTNRMAIQDKNPQEALNNTRMFVQENPDSKEGNIILAQLAFQMGELETAFHAVEAVLAKDPWHFPARLLLTSVRAQQGRLDLAEEQLRFLYGKYPDSAQALLPLADVLLQQGRVPEGRAFLARVIEKDPKNSRARMMMVDSYLREQKADSAQLILDVWKEADPEHLEQLQIRKAKVYSMTNQFAQAREALAPYTDVKEDNFPALSELAVLHVRNGHYDSAITIYGNIGEISPRARMTMETMSMYLHLKNQNPARALETLKSLQVTDKRPALMAPLIAAYLAIGQDNKATAFIEQQPDSIKKSLNAFMSKLLPDKEFIGQWALFNYYAMNKQDFLAFKTAQEMYIRWPRSELATTIYTSQLSSFGAYADAAKVLATLEKPDITQQAALLQLYVSSRQGDKVMALANKLVAAHPDMKGLNLILADYWVKKDKAKAFQYYEKELAVNPENMVVLNNLAWEYGIVQKNLEKAAPYIEKLKAKKNLDPRILDTIGWILANNGKAQEAEPYVRNAIDLVPDHPTFLFHLAFILNQNGHKEEARKNLDAALGSKVPFEERKDAEKLLAQLG